MWSRINLIFLVLLLCTSCNLATLSPSPTPVDLVLPEECQVQLPGLEKDYEYFGYEQGSCGIMAESPDGTTLAYLRLEDKKPPYNAHSVKSEHVVKIIRKDNPIPAEIYRPEYFHILALEWLNDGRLLIWDAPLDLEEVPGVTAVYDPTTNEITHRVDCPLYEGGVIWNDQKTAFYCTSFRVGPCSDSTEGFDFANNRDLPAFTPVIQPDQYIKVEGQPVWSTDGTKVLISIRSGRLVGTVPCRKIEWNPASILRLDLMDDNPQPMIIKADTEHNYYLQTKPDGTYEIISEPYVPVYGECCRG